MQSSSLLPAAVLIIVAVFACKSKEHVDDQDSVQKVRIHVQTVPLETGSMDRQWRLYGKISALSSGIHRYSLPFEARLKSFSIGPGQHVAVHDPLFTIQPSPKTALAARAAADLLREAIERLGQTKSRQADGFATKEELILAEGRLRRAQQTVAIMRRSGQLTESLTIRASVAGMITAITSQPGSLISSGTPILSVAEDASVGASLWIAPYKADHIEIGMLVTLASVDSRSIQRGASDDFAVGSVLRVYGQVDSNTNLVRVLVSLPQPGTFLLGQNVRALLSVGVFNGFLVPRSALVAAAGQSQVFTIVNGHAHAQAVTVIEESEELLLVQGRGLSAGLQVITTGAYQSEDGMEVTVSQ